MKQIIINLILLTWLIIPIAPVIAANNVPITTPAPAQQDCSGASGLCLNVPIGNIKQVSGFEEYLSLWYNFVIGVVGVLAAVIIMWGGFKWLTSRGNSAAISDAKDRIWSAIIGLVLVFLSYNLLYLINPNLVKKIGLPSLESTTPIANIDGNPDNDRDLIDQMSRSVANWTYQNPTANWFYGDILGIDDIVNSAILENNNEALSTYLSGHNVNLDNIDNLSQSDPNTQSGIARIGNLFGEINADYVGNNTFMLDESSTDVITQILDNDADGFNSQTITLTEGRGPFGLFGRRSYTETIINNVDFDYLDNQGQLHHYDLILTGNRENDNRWEINFIPPH